MIQALMFLWFLSGKTYLVAISTCKNFSLKTSLNVPMNSARTWWLNTRYDITKGDITVPNGLSMPSEWRTETWVGVRYYF
ncbi:hypothetical protein O9929_11900 [Vibrio lentus]|nr:hypothetical protein [Vibrio lentus]